MKLNPVAAVLVVVAVVALIIAVRGTQDNLLSAVAGRDVTAPKDTTGATPPAGATSPGQVGNRTAPGPASSDNHGPYSGNGIYGRGGK